MSSAEQRREELKATWELARGCVKCPQLAASRQTVVFGAGNADADLMFVGEAPGANEDRRGLPFVGQAGGLLDQLLGEIGLRRADVFIANVLKCRPPGNRDPLPQEIDNCQDYLFKQLELIQPKLVCTLGNFATKLLRGDPATGITRLHGKAEVRTVGPREVRLYPLFHPAAALYTPSMVATLREDFSRIPDLLREALVDDRPVPAADDRLVPAPHAAGLESTGDGTAPRGKADSTASGHGEASEASAPVIEPSVALAVVEQARAASPDGGVPNPGEERSHPEPVEGSHLEPEEKRLHQEPREDRSRPEPVDRPASPAFLAEPPADSAQLNLF